jgi:transposase/DNA-binding CsgD family transcriptional regulator
VRVTTAFNRMLELPGASVTGVSFERRGVVVRVRLRRRRRVCGRCGQLVRATHETNTRRWRHLDLGGSRCFIECELRRVRCPDCGVRVEAVAFARPGARHTRDFEDVIAFLAQQMAKTPIAALMRVDWATVGRIVERVVADRLDEERLGGLVAIGVDEVSWRRRHRYLSCVADHRTGDIVWIREGRSAATLQAFFDRLGDAGRASIRAVSIDMSAGYENAIRSAVPDAEICFDPWHVVKLAGEAVDRVRRQEWNAHAKSKTPGGKWVKATRWSLLKARERQSLEQLAILGEVQHANRRLYRAFLLKEQLRLLYQLDDPPKRPSCCAPGSRGRRHRDRPAGQVIGHANPRRPLFFFPSELRSPAYQRPTACQNATARDQAASLLCRSYAAPPPGGVGAMSGGGRLLDRDRELAELEAALEGALAGRGELAVVEGPPGIGKSELLRATGERARRRGARLLTARGVEVERDLAFGGVRQLLEPVVEAASPEEAERLFSGAARPATRLFEQGAREATPPVDLEFATHNALYWVLASLADAEPLVLAVDDAHWLDAPSLRLFDFLAPRIEELPALALVATRPLQDGAEETVLGRILTDPASRLIRPRPLSAPAVREVVRQRLGEEPNPAFVEACADVTAGNPFYLAELLRELELHGVHPSAEEAAAVRTIGPRSISLELRFRGRTSGEGMALARTVAVLGDDARLEDAAALADLEDQAAASAADALVRDSILAHGPPLAFTHPIVRTSVYTDIGPHERARMHKRAARLLESAGAPIERVAAQLMRADPARDPWVVDLLRAEGAAAFAKGAPDTGAHYLRRALAEEPDGAARARVLLELAQAETIAANPDAPAHFIEAFALAGDAGARADVAEAGAMVLFVSGHTGDALGMLAAAAQELAHGNPDRTLELEAQLAALAMYDPVAGGQHLARLDRIDEDLSGESRGARMMLCQLAYRRMWRSDNAARAAQLVERALADGRLLAERGPEGPEFAAAAITLFMTDRLEATTRLLDSALAQVREQGSRFGFAFVSFMRGLVAARRGPLLVAEAETGASLEVSIAAGHLIGAAAATGVLIPALLERSALDEAQNALDALAVPLDDLPAQLLFNVLLSGRGRLRLARGDLVGALADLHECGRRNEVLGARHPILVPWRIEAALAHRARGELDSARELAEEELAASRDWGTPGTIGPALRLMGLLSSGEDAIALLRDAAGALGDSPAHLEHARALIDLGAALRRANRRVDAREPLSRGLDLADRCGASVLSQRAQEELHALGARPRRARLTGLEALTASERRVGELAAGGLGNTEIAQTLFVTRKTVEKHLGNVYSKLGVKSRAELPEQFSRLSEPERKAPATPQPAARR